MNAGACPPVDAVFVVQPVVLKIDPGSKTTGLALARVVETDEGEVHHALHLAELTHRGGEIRDRLQHPEIAGIEYQRGELAGWEVRSYLLEKFGRRCAYCGRTNTPFELDHIQPRSRGGSDRVSNLALSCHACNAAKCLSIKATGRGRYSRTNVDESGFPVGYLMRSKQVLGIKTGDRVRAVVPEGVAAQGTHTGRIAVRANKQFRMGKVQGLPARFCRILQRADGYDYAVVATTLRASDRGTPPLPP